MEEDVANGERVDEWRVTLDGKELVRGGKIGFRRLRTLAQPVSGKELKLEIVRGPARPEEIGLKLYSVDPELMAKVMASEAPKRPPAPFELRGVLSVRKRDELTFMVKHPRKIHALTLTPDKAALGGTPVVFRFSYSIDGEKWADDPAEYRLDNVAANPIPQTVALKGTAHVKYVRIRAVRTLAENQALSLAGVELVP